MEEEQLKQLQEEELLKKLGREELERQEREMDREKYVPKPMIPLEAFECPFCNKLYRTNNHHYPCKYDPNVIHCGDCVHGEYQHGGNEENGYLKCAKYRSNNRMVRTNCEFFKRKENSTWRLYSYGSHEEDFNW